MVALHRHQLVRLNDAGWSAVRGRAWDEGAQACLAHWAAHGLPLVVTQQRDALTDDQLALGLPTPLRWQRRRLALQVTLSDVLFFDEFPFAAEVTGLMSPAARSAWRALLAALDVAGATVRVYGSHGWQRITGLGYLHAGSDMDLRLSAADAAAADAVVAVLQAAPLAAPRLDGELTFPDGSAVAWREWSAWREGRVDRVLVKRLHGVAMETDDAWLGERAPC